MASPYGKVGVRDGKGLAQGYRVLVVAGALTVVNSVTVLVTVTAGVEDGGLPGRNVYAVLAEPVVTVEVVVFQTVEVEAAPGADRAETKMPLQTRTVLNFIFSIGVDGLCQRRRGAWTD